MTRGINDRLCDDSEFSRFVVASLNRHSQCDWGEMSIEDKAANDVAFKDAEGRIFSAFTASDNTKIWIITEDDRSATTVLFPSEY